MFKSLFGIISTITISLWLGFTLWSTYLVFDNKIQIYAENGLLENIQVCLLIVACVVYLVNLTFDKNSGTLVLLFCSLLTYAFVLRELDVEKFDIPYALKYIFSGIGRNTSITTALAALVIYAVFSNYSNQKKTVIKFMGTKPGVLLMAAFVLLIIGSFFENYHDITHNVFFEEIFELSAYTLIVLSSFAATPFISNNLVSSISPTKSTHS